MKQMVEISLDDQGRIVIPPLLRSHLGLSAGMTLVVEEGNKGELWLRLQTESPMLVDKQGVLVVRAERIGDLVNITRSERDRRVLELVHRTGL